MSHFNGESEMPERRGKRIMTSLYLDPPVVDDLRRLAAHTRIPMATYLREAVSDLLKKHARDLRRAKQ
jgi:hypothetical protein